MTTRILTILTIIWGSVLYGQGVKTMHLTGDKTPGDYIARDRVYSSGTFRTTGTTGRFYASTNLNLNTTVDYTALDGNGNPIYSGFNAGLPVGAITGSASSTALGDAAYSVPIALPIGIAGMQPSLSVNYNSSAGDGILGVNWMLGGLSEIQRTAVKRYYNGVEGNGLVFDMNDMFVLDGELLVPTSVSTYQGTFKKTNEDFSKITSDNYSFTVLTKDGKTMEYGTSADSKILLNGNQNKCLGFKLNKVTDLNGNYIQYKYTNDNNESLIESIVYTGNSAAGLQPMSTVKFVYEERNDKNTLYKYGGTYTRNKVLAKIVATTKGVLYREYSFKYGFKEKTLLQEVTVRGADGIALNPTKVYWNSSDAILPNTMSLFTDVGNAPNPILRKVFGDFNGDGITDYLSIHKDGVYWNNSNISTRIMQYNDLSVSLADVFVVDYDKDGKDDLYIQQKSNGNVTYDCYRHTSGFSMVSDLSRSISLTSADKSRPLFGDFDADGVLDVIVLKDDNTFLASLGFPFIGSSPYFVGANDVKVANFDGNEASDILVTKGSILYVLYYAKNSQAFYAVASFDASTMQVPNPDIYPFDFTSSFNNAKVGICLDKNKDGLDEIGIIRSFHEVCTQPNPDWVWDTEYENALTNDGYSLSIVNSNSTSDNLFNANYLATNKEYVDLINSSSAKRIHISISNNNLEFRVYGIDGQTITFTTPKTFDDLNFTILQDANGDKKLLVYEKTGKGKDFYFRFPNYDKNFLVGSIVDGYQTSTQFQYDYVSKLPNVKPLEKFVLNKISIKDKYTQTLSETNFVYEQPVFHAYKNYLLGYKSIKTIDFKANTITNTKSVLNTKSDQLILDSILVYIRTTGQPLTKSKQTFQQTFLTYYGSNLSRTTLLTQSSETDQVAGVTETNDFQYDAYGNVLVATQNRGGTAIQKTENTYIQAGTWIPAAVQRCTTTVQYDGDLAKSRVQEYTYDSKGNVLTAIQDPGLAKAVTTTYSQFNMLGQATVSTVSATSLPSQTSTTVYDDSYRFAKQVSNSAGETVSRDYDALGNVRSSTGSNGLTTMYSYDGFGNVNLTTDALGNTVSVSKVWLNDVSMKHLYKTISTASGSGTQTAYYNTENRLIKTEKETFGGKVITESQYNDNGTVYRQSEPRFESEPAKWTTYTYDNFKRVLTATMPDGNQSSNTYSGLITTTTTSLGTTTTTRDVAGKVKILKDEGNNETKYYYNSFGSPLRIETPFKTITMVYDVYNRQTSMTDPSTGTFGYNYNAYGQLVTETDPNNKVSQYIYDSKGRIDYIDYAGNRITYGYGGAGAELNKIKTLSSNNGAENRYEFDSYGRMSKFIQKVAGVDYVTEYGYDVLSRKTRYVYPNGYAVKYLYNDKSDMIEVVEEGSNQSLWKLNTQNSQGQATSETLGGNIPKTTQYDALKNLVKNIDIGTVFSWEFTFDPLNCNLISRWDKKKNLKETFGYDAYDRLKDVTLGTTGTLHLDYSTNGNITYKSDLGNYKYDPAHPEAVAKLDNLTGAMSTVTQVPSWNGNNKVETIKHTQTNLEYKFYYGVDLHKNKVERYLNSTLTETEVFANLYNKILYSNGTQKQILCINGPDGVVAVRIIGTDNVSNLYYLAADHQGNLQALINTNGTIAEEYSYDAWGRRRNPANWTFTAVPVPSLVKFGYSLHDHYDEVGLIDMKGRLYDPLLAQMISADKYVGSDQRADGYNRYNYVFNNPLKFKDITGNHPQDVQYYRDWQFAQRYNFQMRQANSRYDQKMMYDMSVSSSDPSMQQYARGQDQWRAYERDVRTGVYENYTRYMTLGQDAVPVSNSYSSMYGNNGKVFDAMAGFTPVFGGVINFANFAREGNAPMAVLNLGLAISEFGAFNITGASRGASTSEVATRGVFHEIDGIGNAANAHNAAHVNQVINEGQNLVTGVNTRMPLSSLQPTHYITKSQSTMKTFVQGVKSDGDILESIKYAEYNGTNYIVDGHHRYYSAQKLNFSSVPVQQVSLPYGGYNTTSDLFLVGKQPGWWQYYKP